MYGIHDNLKTMAAGYTCGAGGRSTSRSQLPGWARGSLAGIGRKRMSGTLHRDRSTPLPIIPSRGTVDGGEKRMRDRIEQLEKNIIFLGQQHRETLQQLHSQTEQLKKENRELSFRLIMCCCNHQLTSSNSDQTHTADELHSHMTLLQNEVQQLRQALAEEKCRNGRILALLQNRLQHSSSSPVQDQEGGAKQHGHQTILGNEKRIHKTTTSYLQAQVPADNADEKWLRSGRESQPACEFPALKPHLLGDMAERQRRRQAMQKRFSKTTIHTNNNTLQH